MRAFNKRLGFLFFAGVAVVLALSGCGGAESNSAANTVAPTNGSTQSAGGGESANTANSASSLSPVTIENNGRTLTFAEAPRRAVSLSQHTTEIMLALGLEDKMVGTAYLDDQILPELQEAYAKIPVLSKQYPSKEVLLAAEPDFVYAGWKSAFTDKAVGTVEDLEKMGVHAYLQQSSNMTAPGLEDVYADIQNIGRIFRVEPKANELIEKMKTEIRQITDHIKDVARPIPVFVYDSGEDKPYTAANNYMTRLIALAGGKNIFDDVPKGWTSVSWEEVVARKPEVIVIVDYGDKTVEQKRNLLLTKNELADLPAIKNKRIVVLPLSAAAEGIRAPFALKTLAEGLYPEKF
ncbi:ABC transporter substrate-binding protein [Brevibacillus borstelensis]|jgi:iron complex transport system substrate-binding protein|uniref:ABC transporter substrate-binding protein n=1 Tax=Brevibacillus borstelensis TaxID=45462 RepID=UPI0004F291E6|nr:ABC transporter substrate-binding protein [Brevibacillus borstelensis]KKX55915.1 Fe3+-hydroxamate ABC transporter substrate-binding protein [Brevibacillus borstelensis cifa_chp40]NOU57729.1 ABC transporter substrate-binding protein [Brevibacillus borstelensis]